MLKIPLGYIMKLLLKWGVILLIFTVGISPIFGQAVTETSASEEKSFDELSIQKFKALVDSSNLYQKRARQVQEATVYLRKELAGKADSIEIGALAKEILSMESLYVSYLDFADDYYERAKGLGIPFSEISVPISANKITDHKKNVIAGNLPVVLPNQPDSSIMIARDSLRVEDIPTEQDVDTVKSESGYIMEFRILASSQEAGEFPILLNEALPQGLIYRIQIGIFKNLDSKQYFKGIEPVMAESVEGKDLIRYSVGLFSQFEDANEALSKVKERGFTDAFIVAFYNQVRVQVKYARTLEEDKNTEDLSH